MNKWSSNKIATIDRFDHLVENITLDDSSPDWKEIRELVSIKDSHKNFSPRIYPGLDKWNEAISLLALVHRPNKEGHRLCPACLFETPAVLSICTICKGRLISHGVKNRTKVTVASSVEPERHPQDDDVRDHVKQAWEKVKIDLTNDDDDDDDDDEPAPEEEDVQMEEQPEWQIPLKERKKNQSKKMTPVMKKRDPENQIRMRKCLTKNAKKMKVMKGPPVMKSTSGDSRSVR